MKLNYIIASLPITLTNAQASNFFTDKVEAFEIPSEVQSLINSVELQASSAVYELKSVLNDAVSAIPPDVFTQARELLPAKTSKVSTSGASPTMDASLGLARGVVGAAVGWAMANQ